jgi:outer membrane protein OmpA-like peptidoglycan-associated protein
MKQRVLALEFIILIISCSTLIKGEDVRGQDLAILERYPKSERISFDYISQSDEYYKDIHTIGDTYYIDYRSSDNLDKLTNYYVRYFDVNNWEIIFYEKTSSGDKWIARKIDDINEYLAEVNTSIYDEEIMDSKISYRITIAQLAVDDLICSGKKLNDRIENIKAGLINEKRLVLLNDFFYFNKTELKPCAKELLKKLCIILNDDKKSLLKIIVHDDYGVMGVGGVSKSKVQANVIRDYILTIYPFLSNRITSDGKGNSELLYDNDTVIGRMKNRRVEFILSGREK